MQDATRTADQSWREILPYAGLAIAVLLAYGYEIFNFNLTIDEELHAAGGVGVRQWIAQGRWAMALLNYAVLVNPVGPVTSTLIGVSAGALGLVLLVRKIFALDETGAAAVAAVSMTTPTLAFIVTFSTIAYGVGIALLAMALSVYAATKYSWPGLVLGCALAAFAIGIYQPFVFAVAIVAVVIAVRPLSRPSLSWLRRGGYWLAYLAGSALLYVAASAMAVKLSKVQPEYAGQFVDLAGLFREPGDKIDGSLWQLYNVIRLHPAFFGTTSIWLEVMISAGALAAIVGPMLRSEPRRFAINVAALLLVAAIVILAGTLGRSVVPLRSLVYFPVAVAVIVAIGYSESRAYLRMLLLVLSGLAVIGNAAIANHLFASAAAAEFQDRLLAHDIIRAVGTSYPEASKGAGPIRVVAVGSQSWSDTPIRHVRETFGASFFEWGGGLDARIAAYLTLNGLTSAASTPRDRLRVHAMQADMPAWPRDGWIKVSQDVLILKFGDYSRVQRADLCMLGVRAMCDPP